MMRRLARDGKARELRRQQELSIRELAALIDTSAGQLSRWETGQTRPRIASALRWADALELT